MNKLRDAQDPRDRVEPVDPDPPAGVVRRRDNEPAVQRPHEVDGSGDHVCHLRGKIPVGSDTDYYTGFPHRVACKRREMLGGRC